MSRTVVVFGASSYVGAEFVARLLREGCRVVGVTRSPTAARILLPGESDQFSVITGGDLAARIQDQEIDIVNFAYVKDVLPHMLYHENKRLVRSIEDVGRGRCRRLVQISSSDVTGARLGEAVAKRVRWRPLDSYAESKLHTEHLMERAARKLRCALAIVRLGEVIGPDSPEWVAELAQRIMERKPVMFEGPGGYCNATHVANVADYVAEILKRDDSTITDWGDYHHLAEFSSRRWPELFSVMSGAIGQEWTTVPRPLAPAGSVQRLRMLLRRGYRKIPPSYVRAAFGLLPSSPAFERRLTRARSRALPSEPGPSLEVGSGDVLLLDALSTQEEFRSVVLPGWTPPITFDQACDAIAAWLKASGYGMEWTDPGSTE